MISVCSSPDSISYTGVIFYRMYDPGKSIMTCPIPQGYGKKGLMGEQNLFAML
jgi:hypothetical protein